MLLLFEVFCLVEECDFIFVFFNDMVLNELEGLFVLLIVFCFNSCIVVL